jgi:predicted AAA+ superfamily ATPase
MDASTAEEGRYLIRRLPDFNPWWDHGTDATLTVEFDSLQSAFYELHQSVLTKDSAVHPVVGPDGVGKTTLIKQLISALIDSDFVEKFYRTPEFRSEARSGVVPPEHVLYIPFAEDALCQLHAPAQLRSAIDYYETHHLRTQSDSDRHYILLDDIDTIVTQSNTGSATRLHTALTDLLTDHPQRRIIFTGTPDVTDVLQEVDANRLLESENSVDSTAQQLLPMPFSDFLRGRFREIETASNNQRFHRVRARTAFQKAVSAGDPEVIAEQLRSEMENTAIQSADIRRELSHYLTVGGYLGQRLVFPDEPRERRFDSVLRGQSTPEMDTVHESVRDTITRMLRIRAPESGMRDSPSKLVQLSALVATEYPSDAIRFSAITDLLEVDRRTLRDSFLPVLSKLHLVTPSSEYANRRPRSVRLYHRDPGIANAFANRDLNDVLRADQQLEAALTKSVLFDHTVRLSNSLNDSRDPKCGVVKYWAGDSGEVDFIPKIDGRPIPIYWSSQYRLSELVAASEPPGGFQALESFLRSDEYDSDRDSIMEAAQHIVSDADLKSRRTYIDTDDYHGERSNDYVGDGKPPFGIVLTAGHSNQPNPVRIEEPDNLPVPLLELPQWAYLRLV